MCLGRDPVCDQFAAWLLEIGAAAGINAEHEVTLPDHMHCAHNNKQSLINTLYSELLDPAHNAPLPDGYFLDCTILSAKKVDVNEINKSILSSFTGEKVVYTSADSVTERKYKYIREPTGT